MAVLLCGYMYGTPYLHVESHGMYAADTAAQDSVRATTTRTVQVEAEQARISPAPARTEVISSRELRRAACCSLAESFERSPSVEVSFSDAVSGARQIQMLGLSGTYTQTLVEATPLIRSLELPFGFDHIPGPFMESISISKGASSVVNGYEGQTGQINICMHDPFQAPALFVNLYGNTMNRYELNLYGTQNVSDELATMTMFHGRLRRGAIDNNADNFQDAPEFQQLNLVHRWRYNDDNVEWQMFARGILDEYVSGQIEPLNGQPSYELTTDIQRLDAFMKIGLLNPFSAFEESGVALTVTGALAKQNSLFGVRTLESRQNTLHARFSTAITFSDHVKVTAGLSYLFDDVREHMVDTSALWAFNRQNDRVEHVPGLFAEGTFLPTPSLTIVAGLRADAHNLYGTRVIPRIHGKWNVASLTTLRASFGGGWHVPTIFAENLSAYVNSRQVFMDASFMPEQSWNAGVSATHTIEVFGRPVTFDGEVYHTWFSNRVVVDFDKNVRELWVTNLNGVSFATHAMIQMLVAPVERLELLAAWRGVDVQLPLGGEQRMAPMVSRSRLLLTVTWDSEERMWTLDASATYNGPGRLPSTAGNPQQYQHPLEYPGFWRFNTQVTWRYNNMELYVGSENLGNFIQEDPVIGANAPYSQYFDASLAWGPTSPRMAYFGMRWQLD